MLVTINKNLKIPADKALFLYGVDSSLEGHSFQQKIKLVNKYDLLKGGKTKIIIIRNFEFFWINFRR